MSSLVQGNGDDHPEAAHKHLLDAKALLGQQRPDGAAYLSGYVVECALKSLWLHELHGQGPVPAGPSPWRGNQGHDLNYLHRHVGQLAVVAGARTARYLGQATNAVGTSVIGAWNPVMRYRPPEMTSADAQNWYAVADQVFGETIAKMRLDGVL